MTTSWRASSDRMTRAARIVALLLTAALQGCAFMQSGVEYAKSVFDPGVPGAKPLTTAEAEQLSDRQIEQRLGFLTQRLEDNHTHAALWYYGFLAVNAGGMVAGAATAPTEDKNNDQIYDILNSSLGLIGTGYLLAAPLPGRSGARPVIMEMPSVTHADRAAQLAAAEDTLYGAAGRAKQRTGWILHTGNLFINAGAASVLLARESYGNAAMLFFINSAVGEAQILLTPWEPLESWADYRQLVDNGGVPPDPQVHWGIGPLPSGQGLALQASF